MYVDAKKIQLPQNQTPTAIHDSYIPLKNSPTNGWRLLLRPPLNNFLLYLVFQIV